VLCSSLLTALQSKQCIAITSMHDYRPQLHNWPQAATFVCSDK